MSPRWRRIVATLTGAWMFVILTTPMALWACPTHGGQHAAMSQMGMGGGMDMSDMADMAKHKGPGGNQHACTCPGCCCAVAAVGLTAGRLITLPVVPIAVVAQAPQPPVGAPRERTAHHRLPLPQGPPALRA
jgi:hypothetical protein